MLFHLFLAFLERGETIIIISTWSADRLDLLFVNPDLIREQDGYIERIFGQNDADQMVGAVVQQLVLREAASAFDSMLGVSARNIKNAVPIEKNFLSHCLPSPLRVLGQNITSTKATRASALPWPKLFTAKLLPGRRVDARNRERKDDP
ncbi:hypothetical protein AU467_22615 [Mesorhizobium loti]|uniref:Uncharacterized protein n=1 Tax=Rhizobium loti TaxID=381 RepID=A0A124GGC4_RHILI|nr:hypothetical protein AU467_22615 [Mesorhizobium loti]